MREKKIVEKNQKNSALEGEAGQSDYSVSMAQELRTSLTAILGFGDLLKRTPLDDQQKEYLESMLGDGKSLLELVDNMVDISFLKHLITLECDKIYVT